METGWKTRQIKKSFEELSLVLIINPYKNLQCVLEHSIKILNYYTTAGENKSEITQ